MPRFFALVFAFSTLPLAAFAMEWSDDFSRGAAAWALPLPDDWAVSPDANPTLQLKQRGPVGDPRRPVKFALFKPACVTDFELEAAVRRNEKSLLIVFGYQNRDRFYYAHLSSDDGDHSVHNGLFKVQGGSRYRIGGLGSAPALPTKEWTAIRIVRDISSGRIAVFVEDETQPRFEAADRSFGFGRVGLGSFDETGAFDDFRLAGSVSDKCPNSGWSPLDPAP